MSETSAASERAAVIEARRTAYDQAYAEEAYLGVEDELKELAKEADDLGVYALKVKQGGY